MPPLRREHERCDTRVDPLTGVCESGEVGDCDRPGSAAPAVPVRRCTSLYVAAGPRTCRAALASRASAVVAKQVRRSTRTRELRVLARCAAMPIAHWRSG